MNLFKAMVDQLCDVDVLHPMVALPLLTIFFVLTNVCGARHIACSGATLGWALTHLRGARRIACSGATFGWPLTHVRGRPGTLPIVALLSG